MTCIMKRNADIFTEYTEVMEKHVPYKYRISNCNSDLQIVRRCHWNQIIYER